MLLTSVTDLGISNTPSQVQTLRRIEIGTLESIESHPRNGFLVGYSADDIFKVSPDGTYTLEPRRGRRSGGVVAGAPIFITPSYGAGSKWGQPIESYQHVQRIDDCLFHQRAVIDARSQNAYVSQTDILSAFPAYDSSHALAYFVTVEGKSLVVRSVSRRGRTQPGQRLKVTTRFKLNSGPSLGGGCSLSDGRTALLFYDKSGSYILILSATGQSLSRIGIPGAMVDDEINVRRSFATSFNNGKTVGVSTSRGLFLISVA